MKFRYFSGDVIFRSIFRHGRHTFFYRHRFGDFVFFGQSVLFQNQMVHRTNLRKGSRVIQAASYFVGLKRDDDRGVQRVTT